MHRLIDRLVVALPSLLLLGAVVAARPLLELTADAWRLSPRSFVVATVGLASAALAAVVVQAMRGRVSAALALVAAANVIAAISAVVHGAAAPLRDAPVGHSGVPVEVLFAYALPLIALALPRRADAGVAPAVVVVAAVVAATVILDGVGWWPAAVYHRPGGILCNRNYAAQLLALALPWILVVERRTLRWLLLAALAVALVWTRCRAGWIACAAAAAVTAVLVPRARRVVDLVVVAAAVVVALFAPTRLDWRDGSSPYRDSASRLFDVHSGSGRLRVLQHVETWQLVAGQRALGVGPGRWQPLMVARNRRMLALNQFPHSEALRALADGGLALVIVLAALFAVAGAAAWRRADARAGTIVAMLVASAVDAPLVRLSSGVLFWLVVAPLLRGAGREDAGAVYCEAGHDGSGQPTSMPWSALQAPPSVTQPD